MNSFLGGAGHPRRLRGLEVIHSHGALFLRRALPLLGGPLRGGGFLLCEAWRRPARLEACGTSLALCFFFGGPLQRDAK
jgi:hypothetical protein